MVHSSDDTSGAIKTAALKPAPGGTRKPSHTPRFGKLRSKSIVTGTRQTRRFMVVRKRSISVDSPRPKPSPREQPTEKDYASESESESVHNKKRGLLSIVHRVSTESSFSGCFPKLSAYSSPNAVVDIGELECSRHVRRNSHNSVDDDLSVHSKSGFFGGLRRLPSRDIVTVDYDERTFLRNSTSSSRPRRNSTGGTEHYHDLSGSRSHKSHEFCIDHVDYNLEMDRQTQIKTPEQGRAGLAGRFRKIPKLLATNQQKQNPVVIYVDNKEVGSLQFKSHETVAQARRKLSGLFGIPSNSHFNLAGNSGRLVNKDDEEMTYIQACLGERSLYLQTASLDNDSSSSSRKTDCLSFPAAELRDLSPESESVLRYCFQLAEGDIFKDFTKHAHLPSANQNCLKFVKDVARAIVDSRRRKNRPFRPNINWTSLEKKLHLLEDEIRQNNSRQGFAKWWLYRSDQRGIKLTVSQIQRLLHQSPNLELHHPVFYVEFPRASLQVEALLDVLFKASLDDFAGKKYDRTRAELAAYLDTNSDSLKSRIQKHRYGILESSEIHENSLFSHQQSIPSAVKETLKVTVANSALRTILSPLYDFQESYIEREASNFIPKTRNWAFREFDKWLEDPGNPHRCFILTGPTGSGKTSFLARLVRTRQDKVLSYHFCRYDDYRFRDPRMMLLSIVHQLTMQSPHYEWRVRDLLVEYDLTARRLLSQECSLDFIFTELIQVPLYEIRVPETDRFVIVIDGIDCAQQGESSKNEVLNTLHEYLPRLPTWVCYVFATRPKLSILRRLRCFNAKMIEATELRDHEDFRLYFQHVFAASGYQEEKNKFAALLGKNTNGSFLHAAIIRQKLAEYRASGDRRKICEYMINDLNGLLTSELRTTGWHDTELFWNIVKVCAVATKPLTSEIIANFVGCTRSEVESITSISQTFFDRSDSRVRFVHKVVRDWLLARMGELRRNETPMHSTETKGGHKRRRAGHEMRRKSGGYEKKQNSERSKSFTGLSQKTVLLGAFDEIDAEISECHHFFALRLQFLMYFKYPGQSFKFDSEATKEYVLKHGIYHLAVAKMKDEAREVVLDPGWLIARAQDPDGIISCCELLSDGDQTIHLLGRAMKLSTETILSDFRQLVGQLVGRLIAATTDGHGDPIVRQRMAEFVEDLREYNYGFDWWCPVAPTWDQAEEPNLRQLDGHAGPVQSVSFHQEGRRCASGSWDGSIRVWDAVTGLCEMTITDHEDSVWTIDWEPMGKSLASGGMDKSIRVFDTETGVCRAVLDGHGDCVWSVKWSSDGERIASGSRDRTIRIWDAAFQMCLNTLSCDSRCAFYSVDWEGDGESRICSGGTDNVVRIWDSKSGDRLAELKGHRDWVRSVSWCPHGRNIISGSADHTVRVWNSETFALDQVLMGHEEGVWAVAKSPDGQLIASGSTDGSCRIWNCVSGRSDQIFSDHTGPVWSVAWASDGQRLLSGSSDKRVIVWDTAVRKTDGSLPGHSKAIWSLDVSKDSSLIVTGSSDKTARLWNVDAGKCERIFTGHSGPVWSVKFSFDGKKVLTGSTDNTASIYRIVSGEQKLHLLGHTASIWCVAWTIGDKEVVTGSRDMSVRIWNAGNGRCKRVLTGHKRDVKGLAISLDGKRLATASLDMTIRVWDMETKKCKSVLQRKGAGALSVKWHPDSIRIVASYTSGCVWIWSTDTGEREIVFLPGHSKRANCVHWSPDGTKVVSASSDKDIRIWDAGPDSNHCISRFPGSNGNGVYGVKWTADGRFIVSCGADKSIRMFNPETGRCEKVMAAATDLGIYDIAWSKDGKYVAAGSRDRTVEVWNSETGRCEKRMKGHTNWVYYVCWEENGNRILSRSDDQTTRVWDVQTGYCLEVVESEAYVPDDFVLCPIKSLSSNKIDVDAVGLKCDKVKLFDEKKAVGLIRNRVHFFHLTKARSRDGDRETN